MALRAASAVSKITKHTRSSGIDGVGDDDDDDDEEEDGDEDPPS